ncbi:MAG TPA: 30S ribosomal protein S3 [Chloroflexota bacterium]|jgi:small subunit ribosomal protein S3
MGQKVHPVGFRLGINRTWQARWYAGRDYKTLLHEDLMLREYIFTRHRNAGIAMIEIERAVNRVTVMIHTAKPGIVIGKSGANVEELRKVLEQKTGKRVAVNILEIRQPDLNAVLVARNVAEQLEKRVAFKRAMKLTVQRAMQSGAKGIRINVAGRLGGAEMARREWERRGRVPLHTLRADIDFGTAVARTTYGVIGVKVWIYRGDVLPGQLRQTDAVPSGERPAERRRPRAPRGGAGGGGDRPSSQA